MKDIVKYFIGGVVGASAAALITYGAMHPLLDMYRAKSSRLEAEVSKLKEEVKEKRQTILEFVDRELESIKKELEKGKK